MFKHFPKTITAIFIIISINACGGDSSDTSTTSSADSTIPVGFTKSTAEFNQYEAIILETDECHNIWDVYLDNDYIYTQIMDDSSSLLDVPVVYEPGSHTLRVTLENSCVTTGLPEDIYSDVLLNFEMLAAITVANPELYLDERINDAISLIDEMLLTETDAGLITYLTQLRTDLASQLAGLPTMSATSIESNALMLLNNEADLASLPAGFSVTDIYTCEGTAAPDGQVLSQCRFNWLVMSVAGFAISVSTLNVLGAYVSAASFIYHLKKFRAETTDNDVWTDVTTEFQDESGITYLQNEYDSLLPSGLALSSENALIFTENFEQSIKVKITRSVKEADITIIQGIKDAVARVASYLPDPLPAQIAALSHEDQVEYVADMYTYLISDYSISDDRLEISKLTRTGDELFITITPKSDAEFFEDEIASFSLLLHDHHNTEHLFDPLSYVHQTTYSTELSLSIPSDIEISDDRLEITVSSIAGKLDISFTPKVDAVILDDIPFTFSLSDHEGNKQTFNASWSVDIPLPQANNMNFWYDFSGIGLIHGAVDSYDIPSKHSISGGLLIDAKFAETVEIIRAPQYLLPADGVNYLSVWTGNGIENSEVTLYIDPDSFRSHLPDGGEMTDYLQYRVRNASGVSTTKTIYFGSKYMAFIQNMPLDLTTSLPDSSLPYDERETLTVPLSTTAGSINAQYSVSLEITPEYEVWSIVYAPYPTGNYIVRLVVQDKITGAYLSGKEIPEKINVDIWHEGGGFLSVISDGAGGAYESSALSNGPEVYIGDPGWIIVTGDELTAPLIAQVNQNMYGTCKYPTALYEYYHAIDGIYEQYCLN